VHPAVFVSRSFLANLFGLPPAGLYRAAFRGDTGRNHELRVGESRFWGPEEFTSMCRSAMVELEAADETLFSSVTSSGIITFWLKSPVLKAGAYHKRARFYTIDPAYYGWGTQGIVAFVVGIYYDEVHTSRFLGIPVETPQSRTASCQAAADWLTRHGYPSALIDPFRSTNSPNQAMQRTAGRSAF